jgi:hypothetical protein
MNKLAAGLMFFAFSQLIPVAAQTKPENNLSPKARIYEPKYLKGQRAEQVARFVEKVTNVMVRWEPVVNGLLLNSMQGQADELDKAEALLKRFDVPEPVPPPERQIEMTVSLIRAFVDVGRVQGSMPPELASVVKEMKGALPYAGFNLVETLHVNVRDGMKVEDFLPNVPHFYSLEFHEPSVSADGKTVSVRGFRFAVKVPGAMAPGSTYQDVGIATPLTLYDGQKQVLGKIKLDPMSGDDLFVVLSYKLK